MCVQIGNRLFAELRIAHSGLRKGRRNGPDSVAIFARKVSVSNGIQIRSYFGAVGWVDRQERWQERFGEIGQENSRCITGGWAKAAGVVTAGGALAQSGAKRCMYSCDALLCILSVRAESIKVAQSGANCRVNSCAALLFLQKFLRIGAACCADGGGVMVLQPSMFCKKYTFVKVQRWFAVALDFQLWIQRIRLFRLLQGGKGTGHTHLNPYANSVGIPNRGM